MDLICIINIENNTQNNGSEFGHVIYVMGWVVFSLGIPVIFLAIYLLYCLISANHMAPIYVINLLISDLLQMTVVPAMLQGYCHYVVLLVYNFGLTASVGFMVCIALERYLVIAFPLWYRFRRNVKYSFIVSSIVWLFPFFEYLIISLISLKASLFLNAVLTLIPLPLLIFFLVGTLRALSVSISVPVLEKRRIIGTLALVLGIYCFFFLPRVIHDLLVAVQSPVKSHLWGILVMFSSLVDPLLYVFMRSGAKDILMSCPCPCLDRLLPGEHNHTQTTTSVTNNPTSL
ncbi:G-protein coupled receptor 4-like [Osmerus mordax]|uniref:G-protein coupled receptor 4-like n=1 Tax=Osmerus mordax TaxID=8014 RepID=UPI00350F460F